MVKKFGSVFSVISRSENVHHHEVLDVEMLATLLKLINVSPANALHFEHHGCMNFGSFRHDVTNGLATTERNAMLASLLL